MLNISASGYLWQGLRLLTQPALRRFVIIPFLMNVLIFSGIIWLGAHYFNELTQWFQQHLPRWLQWLEWLLWVIFSLLSIIVVFYTFTTVANLITAPFNNLLAEKIEIYLTGEQPPVTTHWWAIMKSIPLAFLRQINLLQYYLLRAAILWLLTFIPGLNIIAVGAWFLFTAWMAAMQYLDYPMDNHHIDLTAMRAAMKQRRWSVLSFGITAMLFTMIPIVNFLAMPAAVAGATIFWVNEFKQK